MATLAQKVQCERDAREMLKQGGLPDPDRVEYGHTCIRLFWEESKVVLVVDIDEPPLPFDFGEYPGDLDLEEGDEDLEDLDLDELDDLDDLDELRRFGDDDAEEAA